jgi:large subunit ribosomal protein L15
MTLALLGSSAKDVFKVPEDPHGREPFQHPATQGIEVLLGRARAHLLHHSRIAEISQQFGLQSVVRWNPKNVSFTFNLRLYRLTFLQPESLQASGLDLVLTQAVLAIVGAVALEKGGGEANRVSRERLIARLGVRSQVLEDSEKPQLQ